MKHPQLQAEAAEADARAVGALAETLAAGQVPPLTADFAWRGKATSADELGRKLGALTGVSLAVLETRVVPSSATLEIGAVLETFSGMPPQPGDRLAVATVSMGNHVISWGLLVDGQGALRAWFDPSPLLQLIAP